MSLILEALRKSEAERRRAQVPDLLAEPQAAVAPAPVAVQRWPWLVLGAVALLGAAWVVRALLPAPATSAEAPVGNREVDTVETPRVAQPAPVRAAPPLRRPLVVAPPIAKAASTSPTSPSAPLPSNGKVSSPIAMAPTPDTAVALSTAPAISPPAPQPRPQANDNLLRVSDLGSEERAQLPPLKLSMHMWNDVPAQRFVIIDGNRLGIGAHIGALTVADIVSDGVVLDWNGRLLKVPLR